MKKVWRWMVVMVVKQRECISRHGTLHLNMVKMVHFMQRYFFKMF